MAAAPCLSVICLHVLHELWVVFSLEADDMGRDPNCFCPQSLARFVWDKKLFRCLTRELTDNRMHLMLVGVMVLLMISSALAGPRHSSPEQAG
ncbi:unnamed protein product [Protopolystoma xenopodis]|uniref:Ion transport domain-containing protein n=1 Tax=Protopolystoma xenopodis TaxID=117903 RepID=A0A3S5BXK6_9PLAT|nr:unnamed protein product [Protopolystoma xenopodis]